MNRLDGRLLEVLTHWQRPWGYRRIVGIVGVALLIGACAAFVLATGGIKFVFSHSMYLPILIAGAVFGPVGGMIAGLVGGVALGPYMPIDTVTGEMQETLNWVYRTGFFVLIGGTTGALVDAVARLAGRDPISGAPSQVPLRHDLSKMIDRQKNGELPGFSLLLFKLDNHAEVASTFGVETGTALLCGLVERLQNAAGRSSKVYHLHGECFGVVAPKEQIRAISELIRGQAAEPIVANGVPVYPNLLIGRADCPDHSQASDPLVQHANAAAETARETVGGQASYDVGRDHANRQNLLLVSRLEHAIAGGELRLHYQPKLDLGNGQIEEVEALVRWQHADHGLLMPERFVPQAEKTHLIHALTAWVLTHALEEASRFRAGGDDWRMAVNLSVRDLGDPDLVPRIDRALAASGCEPQHLEVELTESTLLTDQQQASELLRRLRDRGIGVAIDDFGAGRTSLGYLKHLPASRLKIDRSFVSDVVSDPADQHIVAAIVSMAHDLGMDVVAEGVEDGPTLEVVRELGCDVAQGFLICKPKPADELVGFRFEGN